MKKTKAGKVFLGILAVPMAIIAGTFIFVLGDRIVFEIKSWLLDQSILAD